jgi:hypothetical protein
MIALRRINTGNTMRSYIGRILRKIVNSDPDDIAIDGKYIGSTIDILCMSMGSTICMVCFASSWYNIERSAM